MIIIIFKTLIIFKKKLQMGLWVDKYGPTSLAKLDYNKDQAKILKNLVCCFCIIIIIKVESCNFPHLLVYGPAGAGKRTRIMCILRELYGTGVDRLRMEHHTFVTPSNKKVTISTVSSNYHLEVNPRYVVTVLFFINFLYGKIFYF